MFALKNRQAAIKAKGFNIELESERNVQVFAPSMRDAPLDFSKIKVGAQTLNDAVVNLGYLKTINSELADKDTVLQAIQDADYEKMIEISDFFYRTSGIYSRLCRYLAFLYRYDWMVTPYLVADSVKDTKVLEGFTKSLTYLDNFNLKQFFGDVALKVIRHGCFYGYLIEQTDRAVVQELPAKYCRSRYFVNNRPSVEFNMKFFDDMYRDAGQRQRILSLFPKDFQKGYQLYKLNKLEGDFPGDQRGWYLLDPDYAMKFNINGEDFPFLISVIPSILDLDAAQELDRKKMAQKLLKIIIQKLPLDKNNELIFDVDEAAQLHNNAVKMLTKAIGVDVLTTFAEVDVADMADRNTTTSKDELEKVERAIFNESGVAHNLFNSDGNIALEKSIMNDEASMYNLLLQFEDFINVFLLRGYNKSPKKIYYRAQILTTTIYNYKDMAKLYKEQMQLGYSKMLSQIALGQSQSSVLANAYFENDVLDLVSVFIPPLMSSTMNADVLNNRGGNKQQAGTKDGEGAGRPEKEDDQKSTKTIQNRESMK